MRATRNPTCLLPGIQRRPPWWLETLVHSRIIALKLTSHLRVTFFIGSYMQFLALQLEPIHSIYMLPEANVSWALFTVAR